MTGYNLKHHSHISMGLFGKSQRAVLISPKEFNEITLLSEPSEVNVNNSFNELRYTINGNTFVGLYADCFTFSYYAILKNIQDAHVKLFNKIKGVKS